MSPVATTGTATANDNSARVCMFLSNEVLSDGRVMREAEAIASAYRLTIIGWLRPERKKRFDAEFAKTLPFTIKLKEFVSAKLLPKNIVGYLARYMEMIFRFTFAGLRMRPDIVHAQEQDTLLIGYIVAKCVGAKLIYDAHELYREVPPAGGAIGRFLAPRLESFLMKRCDLVIACNSQRAQIMHKEYGVPVVPSVIRNLPPFSEPSEGGRKLRDFVNNQNPEIEKIIVHPGGLAGRGANVALPALAKLPKSIGLAIIGYANQKTLPEMETLTRKHSLIDRVFYYPRVPYAELAELVAEGDIGLVSYPNTNRNNYFCAPNKLYEYAMAGIPTVAVDYPPCREFLEEYKFGQCFEWNNPDALADAVVNCISDQARYDQMCAEARRAATQTNWDKERKVLISLYDRLIA